MRIHLIAMGGAAMHNMALALQKNGHEVSGSDDEIYNPAKDRLDKEGLLPKKMGWDASRIQANIEAVIVGMHARPDNPELLRAQELGLKIYSYPSFLFEMSKDKKRVVVAGSHGKTTTTAMILHALRKNDIPFDFLVGAQLEGFDHMVQFSDAPLMIIEGDEYLSSPIDRRPKFLHYQPDVSILTGIAWDHINVFPTFENYKEQFDLYLDSHEAGAKVFWFSGDEWLQDLAKDKRKADLQPYNRFVYRNSSNGVELKGNGKWYPIEVFGLHNIQNLKAAQLACQELGIGVVDFLEAMEDFKGAAKRLQVLAKTETFEAYLDFAHAPSKVKATVKAMKEKSGKQPLNAVLELHTFSSLNKAFLPEYRGAMEGAKNAVVFYSEHTLEMKRLPALSKEEVKEAFGHKNLEVITDVEQFHKKIRSFIEEDTKLLLMTSGNLAGFDFEEAFSQFQS